MEGTVKSRVGVDRPARVAVLAVGAPAGEKGGAERFCVGLCDALIRVGAGENEAELRAMAAVEPAHPFSRKSKRRPTGQGKVGVVNDIVQFPRKFGRWLRRMGIAIAFHSNGKPRGLVRRMLCHSNGRVRGIFRHWVFRSSGAPRPVFARWLASGAVSPANGQGRAADWSGVVSTARGLSDAEPWGTWSEGSATYLEFSAPLPEKFAVHLVARAFGPNVGKEFVARVGDSAAKFTLGASDEERVLEFSNPTRSRTIEIDVPAPASPKSLGANSDERTLGIGFVELRIAPVANAAAPLPAPTSRAASILVDFKQSAQAASPMIDFDARSPEAEIVYARLRAARDYFARDS